MPASLPDRVARPPVKSHLSDSQQDRADSQPVRNAAKADYLSAINDVRTRLGKSIEAMAIDAGCPTSAMSDALAGKDGRNFAGHWLLAQGDEFVELVNQTLDARRGTSKRAKHARIGRDLGEIVRRVVEALAS